MRWSLAFWFDEHPSNEYAIKTQNLILTPKHKLSIMETLKRPSEIALDDQCFEHVTCKRSRRYYEQMEHVEVYSHIIELKQLKHKRHVHRERVKFALFLKYLMHYLCLTDEDTYKKAKQVCFVMSFVI
jgi:hypothetical protein